MLSDLRQALSPLRPPSFAQLFFYDLEYVTNVQIDYYLALDRTVLLKLLDILKAYNPFIHLYKTARKRLTEPVNSQFRLFLNLQIRLICDGED